jgi:outer membrane protein assembly factor BamA
VLPWLVLAWLLGAGGAEAQESRAEEVQQQKDQKAAALSTYKPGVLEKALNYFQEEAGAPPIGFFPLFDSIYTQGAVSLGVGYRKPIGDTGAAVVDGAYSIRGFWRVRGKLTLPKFANDRATVEVRAFVLDANRVRYYGIGDNSSKDDESYYAFRGTDVLGEVRFEPARRLTLGAHVAFDGVDTRGGSIDPSIEEVFSPEQAPGLGEDPSFYRLRAFADYRWQEHKGYARRGGMASAKLTAFNARDDQPFDFTRFDLSASQHVPLFRENWVLAFRGLLSTTSTSGGNVVPYFLLPALGESSDEFRGYPALRFRDNHRLLLTGEYRWMASHYMDLALFLDAGKVAADTSDLDFSNLKTAWGVSARLHTPRDTLVHLSAGRSKDGWRFIFGVGPVF